jgi:hypothetical protein
VLHVFIRFILTVVIVECKLRFAAHRVQIVVIITVVSVILTDVHVVSHFVREVQLRLRGVWFGKLL